MTLADRLVEWAIAFAFTEIVEIPIYQRALAADERRGAAARFAIAFGASAITHPVVWFVFPWAFRGLAPLSGYWTMVAAAEAFAVIVEAIWLRAFGVRRALAWAFVANAASVGLGLLSRWLFGYP
jgi:hypothetical protein